MTWRVAPESYLNSGRSHSPYDTMLSTAASFSNGFAILFLLLSATVATATAQLPPNHDQNNPPAEIFRQYLRIRTAHPNPNYAAAADFLSAQARSIGLAFRILEFVPGKPVLLFTWLGSNPSLPSILFNSHMDSVPAEDENWIHPPFSANRDSEGRIFARGSQDDKCLIIQQLEAIRALKRNPKFVPLRSVHISVVPDEEIGGRDGAEKFAASEEFLKLNVGFVLDEGQASPKSQFRVFYADRTPWKLIVKAQGQPGQGAIENLLETMESVARFRDSNFDLVKAGYKATSQVISINPVYFKAGIPYPMGFAMNMLPSEAEVGFDIRIPPTEDPDTIKRRILEEWVPVSKNLTFQLIEAGPIRDNLGRPLLTPTNESNPWWAIFKRAVLESGGELAQPEILSSTTDARFVRLLGIPALGFSPMANTPILLHEHNEFLMDSVFLNGIEVFKHVIRSLSCAEFMEN